MSHFVSKRRAFAYGLCIGSSDLVPGISGGTTALILGVYEQLIDGIRSFDYMQFLKGHFRASVAKMPLAFLGSVFAGMAVAIALLVQFIHFLLSNPIYRPLIYSFFFGLVVASAYIINKRMKHWHYYYLSSAAVGAVIAYFLSGIERGGGLESTLSANYLWVFFCGILGICAMLLPGISGSYILNVVGMYVPVIAALSSFIKGILSFRFEMDAFIFLAFLGLGILFGAIFITRIISWALHHYHDLTMATMVGFMIGALRSVWPFRQELTFDPYLPGMNEWILWASIGLFIGGFALVTMMYSQTKRKAKA